MKKHKGVPKMQNPPPPPPHPSKLRLFHNGRWFTPFDQNGNEILSSKIIIEENFPDCGQEATIRMPVEIVNERPMAEMPSKFSRYWDGCTELEQLRMEVCKLREENDKLRHEVAERRGSR